MVPNTNVVKVKDGDYFHWLLQGPVGRNADTHFSIRIRMSRSANGAPGITLDHTGTCIPDTLRITAQCSNFDLTNDARVLFPVHETVGLMFEDRWYPLFTILFEDFEIGVKATVLFHYLPSGPDQNGEILR